MRAKPFSRFMDSITQAALGAVVGERLLGKKLGRRAIGWGALVGTLPDLDILVYPWLDPIAELYWHRGLSHSIVGVLLGTALFGWILARFWNREKALQRRNGSVIGLPLVLLFLFLNFSSHVLIDCFTVYGTQLLEPFSNRRFGLNNLFIIDPLFTLPLLIWIAAALIRKQPKGTAPKGVVVACSFVIGGCLTFSFAAQTLASQRFEKELAAQGIVPERSMVSPTPFNTLLWRGVFETEDAFWIGYWAVNDSEEPLVFKKVEHSRHLLKPYLEDRGIACVVWFSENTLLVEPSPEGGFLLNDLRFAEFWPDDTDGMPRTFFSWHVVPEAMEEDAVFEQVRSSRPELSSFVNSFVARLGGERGAFLP
jgi:inner membrane protein